MKQTWEFLRSEPVALTEAARSVISALMIFGVLHWTTDQLAAFMLAFGALTVLFLRQSVTPNINVRSRVKKD